MLPVVGRPGTSLVRRSWCSGERRIHGADDASRPEFDLGSSTKIMSEAPLDQPGAEPTTGRRLNWRATALLPASVKPGGIALLDMGWAAGIPPHLPAGAFQHVLSWCP